MCGFCGAMSSDLQSKSINYHKTKDKKVLKIKMAGFRNTLLPTFALAFFSGIHSVLGQNQRAVLYDQYNGGGNYVFIPERYVENLGDERFDDRTHSVCVTGT